MAAITEADPDPEDGAGEYPEDGEHAYTSTACQHGKHGRCRLRCKFCDAPCGCRCHDGRDEGRAVTDRWCLEPIGGGQCLLAPGHLGKHDPSPPRTFATAGYVPRAFSDSGD